MSRPTARMGDASNHGGRIITGAVRVMLNGKPVARLGDLHVCPKPGHGVTRIVSGSTATITEGKPTARLGDITACGAKIVAASTNGTA